MSDVAYGAAPIGPQGLCAFRGLVRDHNDSMADGRVETLCGAVQTLREYTDDPIRTHRDMAGVARGFAIAFKLSWKCIRVRAKELGCLKKGAKSVLAASIGEGIIPPSDEPVWLAMLKDVRLTSRVYNKRLAEGLCDRIVKSHVGALEAFAARLS